MAGTEIVKLDPNTDSSETIDLAAGLVRNGGLVAFPTETVYGVGARADLPSAVARLRKVKQRLDEKPFTVHIGRPRDVDRYVPGLAGLGRRLVNKGWPGPLTLIFQVTDPGTTPVMRQVEPSISRTMYHHQTIGLRCPDDPTAAALLNAVGAPVIAASANLPGQAAPRDARQVVAELGDQVDLILDAGPTRYAKASTIVRVDQDSYELVREGVFDERTIRRLATLTVLFVCTGNTCRSPMAAALARQLLANRLQIDPAELAVRGFNIISAGTFCGGGSSASPQAVEVMARHGIDLTHHRSQMLTPELVWQADFVYTMTESHLRAVVDLAPQAKDRCRLLDDEGGIDDPIGKPVDVYAACARRIATALEQRVEEVLA